MRVDTLRLNTNCLFKLLRCTLCITKLRERDSKIDPCSYAIRAGCDCLAKLRSCVRISLRLERQLPTRKMHAYTLNQILKTVYERIRNPHANRSLLGQMSFYFFNIAKSAVSHRH